MYACTGVQASVVCGPWECRLGLLNRGGRYSTPYYRCSNVNCVDGQGRDLCAWSKLRDGMEGHMFSDAQMQVEWFCDCVRRALGMSHLEAES